MQEESIKQASEIIITSLNESKIMELDKLELIMNIHHFLMEYEENIKILNKAKVKKRCFGQG